MVTGDAKGYWESALSGATQSIGLAVGDMRAAGADGCGSAGRLLEPPLVMRVRAFAAAHGVDPGQVLLASFLVLLHRLSSQADLVIQHRNGDGPALPLRFGLTEGTDVAACLSLVATRVDEAARHAPAFAASDAAAIRWQALFSEGAIDAPCEDGTLLAMRLGEADASGRLPVRLEFADSLLDARQAEHWLGCWETLLCSMLDDARGLVADLPMFDEAQRSAAVERWNGTTVAFPEVAGVHRLFEAQVARTPDAIALVHGDERLTYAELNARANRLARHLRSCGVGRDGRVAIHVERGVGVVLGLLATLKAGGAYVPLDPTYPADRLAYTLSDSQPRVLLTMSGMEPVADGAPGGKPGGLVVIDLLATDAPWAEQPAHDLSPGECDVRADDLAYVLYTSGSTGQPKGVAMPHGPLANLIQWQVREPGHDAPLRTLQYAALGFDVAFQETFATLATGGELHLIDQDARLAAGRLFDFIVEHRIERMFLPYFALQMLAEGLEGHIASLPAGEPVRCDLREVITAGEQLRIEPKIVRFFERLPGCRLHNHYGPTETHVVTALTLPADPATWPRLPSIGRPIANARVYVLDERGRPLPEGAAGELYLAGPVVARGYLGRDALSSERFLPDPFVGGGARMYRTGDLGRWLPDGNLECLGRQDFQVKIRGFRVEPGEIEAQLMAFPGVRQAGVLAREDVPGMTRLVAYVSAQDAAAPVDLEQLRRHLVAQLPDYMVPVAFVQMDALPLSPNGKLDRAQLPRPGRERPEWAGPYAAPRTPVEAALCRIFAEVLDLEGLGRDDSFFDLGGSSLLVIRVLEAAHREGIGDVPATALFNSPTPATLAAEITSGDVPRAIDAVRMSRGRGGSDGEAIAIIAMAGRFPGAASVEALWEGLCAGRDGVARFSADELDAAIPEALRADPAYVPARGVFDDFDGFDAAFFGISHKEAELMDPQQRVFLELCWECIERAGRVPDATGAPVGVFAGMYNASYYQNHVLAHPDLIENLGAFQVMLGNEKDYIATRIAHKLDLTGPAVSVHTACSTSLVAIVQAVDSLRAGRCTMALAGGVAVTCPVRSGHLYQEGGMLSADGATRSFDAGATGTVFSDGAAVVLLKRLSEAIADGDPIHAVIRGAAINNDGGGKASFTAPSSDGQAAVIAMAHADAGVEPRSIGYVEAHGTATPMGDPIEIEGLTRAFRQGTRDTGFCVVGSVKSNIGHTLMAAGAAGVIKTALALENGCIPPTAHFREGNPSIDFGSTPFRASGELLPWPASPDGPRRAGVSSFGVGGTNAHVVMEQAPPVVPSDVAQGPQLLVLSARTPVALQASITRLADHLEANPAQNFADIAWTLAVGRKAMGHRVAVAAVDSAATVTRLRDASLAAAAAKTVAAKDGGVVFLFPGQGCQYAGMGRELYEREPAFREAFDACAAVLDVELGQGLRALVFGDNAEALLPTAVMQPAIFSIEYSLARWWMAQGLTPAAMVGHSIGEFVAATLAGVFELADALRLVARRGRLMQAQPTGAMLSVRQPGAALLARLPDGLSLAAENAPGASVVSGPHELVSSFQQQLEAEGVACRALRTSHAFHSSMMEPAVAPFRAEVEALPRQAPSIPIFSTATGDLLDAEQAVSADYWARHLRDTVRFSGALASALEVVQPRALLEIGPRNTLTALSRQQPLLREQGVAAIASLGDNPAGEATALLDAFGQAWSRGLALRPELLDRRARRRRVLLPAYPFERKRCWLDAHSVAPAVAEAVAQDVADAAVPGAAAVTGPVPAGLAEVFDEQLRLMSGHLDALEHSGVADREWLLSVVRDQQALMARQMVLAQALQPHQEPDQQPGRVDPAAPPTTVPVAPAPDAAESTVAAPADDAPVPTTEPQREIWLAARIDPSVALAFNQSISLSLQGRLDVAALLAALRATVDRHDALRSTISADGEWLHVQPTMTLDMPVTDLGALAADGQPEALAGRKRAGVETPFDLERGPLLRAELVRLSNEGHVLLLHAHHMVCDGWSWNVIVHELGALYSRECGGQGPGLPAARSFREYARLLALQPELSVSPDDEAWWLARLADGGPVLDLPVDRPRSPERDPAAGFAVRTLDAELMEAVRRTGSAHGTSFYVSLLSAFGLLLSRLSAQDDLVVGIPVAGQADEGSGGPLVGHCVNLLPLRLAIDHAQSFAALLEATRTTVLDAMEHQRCTFGSLLKKLRIERDASRPPLVSAVFNVDQVADRERDAFAGLVLDLSVTPMVCDNFDFSINAVPSQDGLRLECLYSSALFDAATVDAWLEAYESVLRGLVRDSAQRLSGLPLVEGEARERLRDLQPAPVAFDAECRMHEHFERQCDVDGGRIALWQDGDTTSYAALEAQGNRIAHLLRSRGIARGALVGIMLERTPRMPAAVLGTLKAGAGYVPLDPEQPPARLAAIARDARLSVILTETVHARRLAVEGVTLLALDVPGDLAPDLPTTRIGRDADAAMPDSVAYVAYTSGSTGTPKGVRVPHRAVANLIACMQRWLRLGAEDAVAAVTPLSFDPSVVDLCLPLSVGARVVLVDRDTAVHGAAFRQMMERSGATYLDATPSGWRVLLDAGWRGSPGFKAICGGEAMPPDVATALLERGAELWNMYGPTETTVTATGARIATSADGLPDIHIGRPVDNSSVWILDRFGHLCPRGTAGEICIGGEGLSLGYLDRPELMAKQFVPDVFSAAMETGSGSPRLYRTGDRGRWRADGNLVHLGRQDRQVKLRGYRIEPGDIEAALRADASVAEAAVVVREDGQGAAGLVAYVVARSGASVDETALAEGLRDQLPPYMLPERVVVLDAMPVSTTGKLAPSKLPVVPHDEVAEAAVRRDDGTAASRIAAKMAELLDLPDFDPEQDFFAAGGHSLLAARLASWLEQAFGTRVKLRLLFDTPTPAALAEVLLARPEAETTGSDVLDIPRQPDQSIGPLSLMQQRLWVQEQIQPDSTNYMIPSALRLRGPLDLRALDRALADVVRRQPALRTVLEAYEGGAVQRVLDDLPVTLLPEEDLTAFPAGERHAEFLRRVDPLIRAPIRTDDAPLFRVRLFRLSNEDHILYLQVHHAVWDGTSFRLFCKEMATLYACHTSGVSPMLRPLERSYIDFAAWHSVAADSEDVRAQIAHWRERLSGGVEPLRLPADFPRPAMPSGRGGSEFVRVEAALAQRLRELGQAHHATLFMTLLAAYFAFLHRTSGQRDLVVGLPVRSHLTEQLQEVMGFFSNVLPMRLELDPEWTFAELLGHVRDEMMACFAHPDVPVERLLQELEIPRDMSRSPLYQALFSMDDSRGQARQWGELRCDDLTLPNYSALTDLSLWVDEDDERLLIDFNYNADVIAAPSAKFMAHRFVGLLARLVAEADVAIGNIETRGDEDCEALATWNDTSTNLPQATSLPGLLAPQVERAPERIALRFGARTLTYRELDARSSRLADALAARGVGAGDLVGVCLERDPDLVATLLAVLKLGAAYVPLDPAYPADRLRFMVADAGLALLVSVGELADGFALQPSQQLLLDRDAGEIESAPVLAREVDPAGRDAPAYVIYTSGSTGTPKGVAVPNGAVINFLQAMRETPGLGPEDILLGVTTTSFDISVLEIFLPLWVGATLVLATREQAGDGAKLVALLEDERATVLQATPITWHLLLEAGWKPQRGFRALCGGEPLSAELAGLLIDRGVELWNMYGPTETTVWSTCARIERTGDAGTLDIHVGRPIGNTTVWVMDPHGQVCPVGVPGEICIGGAGVALGYLGREALTAERFVADRVAPRDHGTGLAPRLYRTGDRGRWRHDGMIEHQGRLDFQLKLRGHRIEPGEIEASLDADPGIVRSVVTVRGDAPGDQRLVAYVIVADRDRFDDRAQLVRLRGILPAYMVPQHILVLDALPLLPNGKVDRASLPRPQPRKPAEAVAGGPGAAREEPPRHGTAGAVSYVTALCSDLVGAPVAADYNFFDAGGHSLLAVRFINRIHRETGVRLNVLALATSTLEQLGEQIAGSERFAPMKAKAALRGGPISQFRKWLFPTRRRVPSELQE
ncbi:amino acid adenylation domain-containing protein [Luteimonas sp. A277]